MKQLLKNLLTTFVLLFTITLGAQADKDTPVKVNQLPAKAQTILRTHFNGEKVALAKKEADLFGKSYEVIFTTGDKIEFDGSGEWTDISCKRSAVPAGLVPAPIKAYVRAHYAGARITEIERDDRKGYDVKLSNKVGIDFNSKFKVVKVD